MLTTSDYDAVRRCDIQRQTEAERLITEAMYAVERIPAADVRLTDAVSLLAAAKTRVADFVDGIEGLRTYPSQSGVWPVAQPSPVTEA